MESQELEISRRGILLIDDDVTWNVFLRLILSIYVYRGFEFLMVMISTFKSSYKLNVVPRLHPVYDQGFYYIHLGNRSFHFSYFLISIMGKKLTLQGLDQRNPLSRISLIWDCYLVMIVTSVATRMLISIYFAHQTKKHRIWSFEVKVEAKLSFSNFYLFP